MLTTRPASTTPRTTSTSPGTGAAAATADSRRARLKRWFSFDEESLANACLALSAVSGVLVPYYLLEPDGPEDAAEDQPTPSGRSSV